MKSFLAGLGIGVGVGVLLAPEAGSETRKKIKEKIDGAAEQVSAASKSVVDAVRTKVEQVANMEYGAQPVQQESASGGNSNRVLDILNSASKTRLMSVSGIGDATARRIIEHRPYTEAAYVIENHILSPELLAKLEKDLIDEEAA
jgi:DNA uptake protein ComE-like DNA-binding protein